jgi:hypothetical protein
MKTDRAATQLEIRAAEALKALLDQVSAVKLKEMRRPSPARGRAREILVDVDVYGHSYTLACEINADTRPGTMRAAIKKLQNCAAQLDRQATPVFIAPYLSPEAQALCKESHAGFLDLEGNARLALGEVFIGMRSVHQRPAARSAA